MWNRILGAASIVGVALLIAASPGTGQPGTGQTGTPQPGTTVMSPAALGYKQGMETMHAAMMKPMTGNADQDFAQMMIAHHQGAIDMARVEIQYGADPALKERAQTIIDEQGKEIDELKQWQKEHKLTQ
ncbi:MAG: DUF305 domain-containing protein [Pseudomonadota bacterium]|nr:DUF305 domain-containing protein [Pseudomonadota bacterium]